MVRLEGDKDFAFSPATVWEKLSDARFLVQCVPGVEDVTHSDKSNAQCVLRPGFAFVRGTLELTFEVVEVAPPTSARLTLHSKGIGSSSEVETNLALAPAAGGTRVHWIAEIRTLGGLLKAVPQGLIRASAQKVIADALAAVEQKMSLPDG
jgi:carbon monoxide dehydrogenase subunit G